MNEFELKDNEIMIFTDFNNTLVDYENEYNHYICQYDDYFNRASESTKAKLTKCLNEFERKTGLVPIVCVVTNASLFAVDSNGANGIHNDLFMTFFNHANYTDAEAKQLYDFGCEKYFKYLLYKENDVFFKINPLAKTMEDMFEMIEFGETAKEIRLAPKFKKLESVERMMTVVDPNGTKTKYCIFAGDSIENDYPMKLVQTNEGVCKIFIRPGKVQKMKLSLMQEFCRAKGVEFSSVHPRTGKKIKAVDESNLQFLTETDRANLLNFSDGDHILLTSKNSRGLIEGLYQSIDIINAVKNGKQKQFGE